MAGFECRLRRSILTEHLLPEGAHMIAPHSFFKGDWPELGHRTLKTQADFRYNTTKYTGNHRIHEKQLNHKLGPVGLAAAVDSRL